MSNKSGYTLYSPFVSIIILNYNGVHHLKECLESVLQTKYPNFEAILVDNCSKDGSVEFVLENILPLYTLRRVPLKIVRSPRNLGFAGGNNLGIKYSKGKYIVFLNNDTRVDQYWIPRLIEVMEKDRSTGVAQCKILKYGSNNLIDSLGIDLYLLGIVTVRGREMKDNNQCNYVHDIPAAHAGIAMFRRSVIEEIGGFDRDYFIMKEDDDISLRAQLSGWRIVLAPEAIVYHKGGGTRNRFGTIQNIYHIRRNGIATIIKNYETRSLLVYLSPTLLLYFIRGLFAKNKGDYFYAYMKALFWVLLNFRLLIRKRRFVQRLRKVSDKDLIARQVLKKPTLKSFIEGF